MAEEKEISGNQKEENQDQKSKDSEVTKNQSFNNDGASMFPGKKDQEEQNEEKSGNKNEDNKQ